MSYELSEGASALSIREESALSSKVSALTFRGIINSTVEEDGRRLRRSIENICETVFATYKWCQDPNRTDLEKRKQIAGLSLLEGDVVFIGAFADSECKECNNVDIQQEMVDISGRIGYFFFVLLV